MLENRLTLTIHNAMRIIFMETSSFKQTKQIFFVSDEDVIEYISVQAEPAKWFHVVYCFSQHSLTRSLPFHSHFYEYIYKTTHTEIIYLSLQFACYCRCFDSHFLLFSFSSFSWKIQMLRDSTKWSELCACNSTRCFQRNVEINLD